jgi:hypothetical protein
MPFISLLGYYAQSDPANIWFKQVVRASIAFRTT